MAKQFLTPINMNKNEIQNAVMQPLASPPMNPKMGQYYFDSTDKRMYVYNGERWISAGIKYELELGETTEETVKIKIVGDGGDDGSSILQGYVSELDLPIATAEQAGLLTAEAFENLPSGIKLTRGLHTDGTSTVLGIALKRDDDTVIGDSGRVKIGDNLRFSGSDDYADGVLSVITDSEIADGSKNVPTTPAVKAYVDNAIASLPAEQFLDLTNTTYVDNFTWSTATYPNSTNPNLDGKPVLVLALKDNDGNIQYGFVSLNDLVDVYTGDGTYIDITSGTVSHKNSGVSAGSYGDSGVQTPAFGGKFKALYVTVDAKGHITGISAHDVTIPNAVASTSADGLMAATDKTKLGKVTTNTYVKTGSIAAGQTSATVALTASADKVIAVNTYLSGESVECDWSVSGTTVTVSIAEALTSAISIEVFAMATL